MAFHQGVVQLLSLVQRQLLITHYQYSCPILTYRSTLFPIMVSAAEDGPCLALKLHMLICPQEHFNYYTMDAALGHLVFSMKYDVIGDQEHLRLMLRYDSILFLSLTCFSPICVSTVLCDVPSQLFSTLSALHLLHFLLHDPVLTLNP